MGRGWRANLVAACAVVAVVALAAGAEGAAAASHRFQTGFFDDVTFTGPFAGTGFTRAAEAGGTIVRLGVNWNSVAPTRPADPKNPADPAYRWAGLDAEVAAAIAAGQAPIADIHAAPVWALSTAGAYPAAYPDPAQFAAFAHAAAQHYDGVHGPRVAIWEIFNEPNLGLWLEPQFVNGQPESAILVPRRGQPECAADQVGARRQSDRRGEHGAVLRPDAVDAGRQPDVGPARLPARIPVPHTRADGRYGAARLPGDRGLRRVVAPSVHRGRADAGGDSSGRRRARAICRS